MPHVRFPAVLQLQTTIFHDPVFVSATNAEVNGDQVFNGFLDRLKSSHVDVLADDAMTVTRIDHHIGRLDPKLFLNARTDLAKIIVAYVSDFTDGNGVDRNDHGCCFVSFENKSLHEQWIIHQPVAVGDVHFRGTCHQRVRKRRLYDRQTDPSRTAH